MPHFATPTTVTKVPKTEQRPPVLSVRDVSVVREGRTTLDRVTLEIHDGERWVILGPNGCGKTTLLRLMSLHLHPSSGDVSVNGELLGTFDVRRVRTRLAHVSASFATELRPALTAHDAVMTAAHGALETWWHEYTDDHRAKATSCLDAMGIAHLAASPLSALSSGELQRVLIARALMCDPMALLFDEPTARLDLGGREHVVGILDGFARSHPRLPMITVTHHVDEIPVTTTHCALMRHGRIVSAGHVDDSLTSGALSDCFGMRLRLERRPNGRRTAYAI